MLRFRTIRAKQIPVRGLLELVPGNADHYRSQDCDPQFQIEVEGGIGALVPGWYLVNIDIDPPSGDLASPCFYPDYGHGCAESTRIDLPNPGPDGIRALVLIASPLQSLRFDPSERPTEFRVGSVTFRRLNKCTAFLMLIAGAHRTRHHDSGISGWAAAKEFFRNVLKQGITPAVRELQKHYAASFGKSVRDYSGWLSRFDSQPEKAKPPPSGGPLVSIVMPIFDPPLEMLRCAIQSVRTQTYENWQLCIANDASTNEEIATYLRKCAAEEPRIKVVFRAERGHICAASNSAIKLAEGAYVGFLDHDDMLHPDALHEVTRAIGECPQTRLVYTDEDKLDPHGQRIDPYFKPAWNPALLRSQNYFCHFLVLEKSLLDQVGGFRQGFEGAQDHDLVLRCVEKLDPDEILHVPKVLYHWRISQQSTAGGVAAKPYAVQAGRLAVLSHLERLGVAGEVAALGNGYYRVRPELPPARPKVSIIIPTRDRAELLSRCVSSVLERSSYDAYEIILVDNGSRDPDALELLQQLAWRPNVQIVRQPGPFNFSKLVNAGVDAAGGEFVCLLNNDIEVISSDWLEEMVSRTFFPGVGAVGAMLYYPDDTIQHAGVLLGLGGVAGHAHGRLPRGASGYMSRARLAQNLTAVTAACLLVRRSLYQQIGGFDPQLAVAFNDIDFCLRLHDAGYFNVWTPFAELYHYESASRGYEDTPEKQQRFLREGQIMRERWGDILDSDPAYNPNLALDGADFSLAFPPRKVMHRAAFTPIKNNDRQSSHERSTFAAG